MSDAYEKLVSVNLGGTVEQFFRNYIACANEKRFHGYFSVNPAGDLQMTIQLENELQDWEIVGNDLKLAQRLEDYVLLLNPHELNFAK